MVYLHREPTSVAIANGATPAKYLQLPQSAKTNNNPHSSPSPPLDISQMMMIWTQALKAIFWDNPLPNEILFKILEPFFKGKENQSLTLTAENMREILRQKERSHLLSLNTEVGEVAKTIFWGYNTIVIHAKVNPKYKHVASGEDTSAEPAILVRLPPLKHRELTILLQRQKKLFAREIKGTRNASLILGSILLTLRMAVNKASYQNGYGALRCTSRPFHPV